MSQAKRILVTGLLLVSLGCTSTPQHQTTTKFDGKYAMRYTRTMVNGQAVDAETREVGEFLIFQGQAVIKIINQEKQRIRLEGYVNADGNLDVIGKVGKADMVINAQIREDAKISGNYSFQLGNNKIEGIFDADRISTDTSEAKDVNLNELGFSLQG